MTNFIGNINSLSYENIVSNNVGYGKLYVPVSKSALLYSHFEHVQGVTAQNGQSGVSITKLRILNSMIEHVSSGKLDKEELSNMNDSQMDDLMEKYSTQIKKAMQTPYKLTGAQPLAGEIFSIQA